MAGTELQAGPEGYIQYSRGETTGDFVIKARDLQILHGWMVSFSDPIESISRDLGVIKAWPINRNPVNENVYGSEAEIVMREAILRTLFDIEAEKYSMRTIQTQADGAKIKDFLGDPKRQVDEEAGIIFMLTKTGEVNGQPKFQLWEVKPRPGQSAYEQSVSRAA